LTDIFAGLACLYFESASANLCSDEPSRVPPARARSPAPVSREPAAWSPPPSGQFHRS